MFSGFDREYRSVELAYGQGLFQEALAKAQDLLAQGENEITVPERQRLQLLLGHIHFHGLGQPELALPLYRGVLETADDPTTRDLAAQGLEFCEQSLQEPSTQPPASVAAMPWLEEPAAAAGPARQKPLPEEEPAAPADVVALEAPPVGAPVEEVRVRVLDDEPAPAPPSIPFTAAEEAELAAGLLRVVLR